MTIIPFNRIPRAYEKFEACTGCICADVCQGYPIWLNLERWGIWCREIDQLAWSRGGARACDVFIRHSQELGELSKPQDLGIGR